jgi:hypothetical protein
MGKNAAVSHGLEETVSQLRQEFGNDFIAVDEGIAVAMDVLKLTLEFETQQFEDIKVKAEDHGNHGATSSAGRYAYSITANSSRMRTPKVELFKNGEDGIKILLYQGFMKR